MGRTMIKKVIKPILLGILALVIVLFILFRIGIGFIQTSKGYITWYFNGNIEDFQLIAENLIKSDDSLDFWRNIEYSKLYNDDNFKAVGKNVSSKIIKTMQLGNYYNIFYYSSSENHLIEFKISNFMVRVGEPFGTVYSESKPDNRDDPDDFVLCYEEICDNWYYCYRYENRTYGG